MKKIIVLSVFLLAVMSLHAQENRSPIKVGGQFYLASYYDSYKSVDNRDGVSYSYPQAPNLDPNGRDLNKVGQFGMSVYQTRLNVEAAGFSLLNANARFYAETDFMGSSSDFVQMIRLRHAYLDLHWQKDEILFGQTNNLNYPSEVTSGVLTAGAGSPIAILHRPIMARYGHKLGGNWKVYTALSYHRVQVGNSGASRNSALPSIEGRIQYGNGRVFLGLSGGAKLLRPRLVTDTGYEASAKIGSADMTAFLRWNSNGHTFKAQTAYGGNMSHLGMIGGYVKRADLMPEGTEFDYWYTNLKTMSIWAEFETKSYNNFHWGIFGGYMENLGSVKEVDPSVLYARHANLHYTGRISPRLTWFKDKLLLGVEYSLFWSKWGKTFDEHYLPIESHDMTYNNRVTFLVRYTF